VNATGVIRSAAPQEFDAQVRISSYGSLVVDGTATFNGNVTGTENTPMTTAGDMIYESSTPAPARLAIGTTGQALLVSGGLPAWGTLGFAGGGTSATTQQAALDAIAGSTANNQVLAGDGTHVTLRALAAGDLPSATSGAVGAVRLTGDLGGTAASPQVVATHLASALPRAQGGTGVTTTPAAPASFAPSNPASTTSTTLVMMGLGSTCAFTPASSGKVLVNVIAYVATATAAVSATVGARYGTGTAPSNGAAVTGTAFGGAADPAVTGSGTGNRSCVAFTAVLSLSASTAYWFDLALLTANASDAASVINVQMSFLETS
jgi:hypothetical protein